MVLGDHSFCWGRPGVSPGTVVLRWRALSLSPPCLFTRQNPSLVDQQRKEINKKNIFCRNGRHLSVSMRRQ